MAKQVEMTVFDIVDETGNVVSDGYLTRTAAEFRRDLRAKNGQKGLNVKARQTVGYAVETEETIVDGRKLGNRLW